MRERERERENENENESNELHLVFVETLKLEGKELGP